MRKIPLDFKHLEQDLCKRWDPRKILKEGREILEEKLVLLDFLGSTLPLMLRYLVHGLKRHQMA